MNLKNTFIVGLIITFNTNLLKAQLGYQDASTTYMLDEFIKRQDVGVSYKDVKHYKGTPYSNPNFLIGNVKGSKLLASNVALRYNAMEDEMEVKKK